MPVVQVGEGLRSRLMRRYQSAEATLPESFSLPATDPKIGTRLADSTVRGRRERDSRC